MKSMKFKALKSDEENMWVVFSEDLPERYGFSLKPELLGEHTTMKDLKYLYPEIDFSRFKLIDLIVQDYKSKL